MKHPHCNRSHAAHFFWCRGFAPVFFIVSIALIVVAIGSGIYFAVDKETAQAPSPQEAVSLPVSEVVESVVVATSTAVASNAVTPPASLVATKTAPIAIVNCGSSAKTAPQCIAEHIKTCSPAKGIVVDPASGLTVERVIDGYKGDVCSYRTTIISGGGELALLSGMDIDCMLPKATLASTVKDGSMSQEDLFVYCTGSFMDFMREQMNYSSQ
ncbi:MAG: hypothetical protein UY31_C0069G0003 [Candidatus Wolfebacteria bacterium GW2011_GWE1_48_7]|uniref:Uncharacterized protein n=2 Tax=Candidatus Wolfeibacteriota TaxID=1752735 RepID=A0A0G1U7V8_9BACT|nr:MAG: hypothetical protein UX70_C0001G0385 [Candidatus Wolfebacteria bacterium GW2011_GWB1_47_1]KKU37045.1 MAG: hypothetical protein UX49_C0003G0007 [Candidatus Wolfebacteria bacterium GW2011_GWC2_46_275]KKU42592.1 MAG: hypothetical protein UX58_C0001G0024 [Candidatus Wolfebacteria bacterium GW2011_GWB2_46_69]KKU54673.1 MAG: hypothetical protein UX76_C0001G0132 [Candidatus Wolfebacteria bacterium GW2011_GWC1_47_103]KKU59155.1 MAG: hypothetical protein UX83_C0007G0003 [Candidatus Wolfebacteria